MRFIVQYWLKSDLLDTPTTERIFDNTTELRDWIKPKLDNNNLKLYQWTILLDKTDVGEGYFNDLIARAEETPKYRNWVKPYAKQIRQLLNL